MKGRNKKSWSPNVYTILFLLVIVSAILIRIVPVGNYERITEDSVVEVMAGTYYEISQNPQGSWEISQALAAGLKNQFSLIYMILPIGAVVYMVTETKATDTILMKLAEVVGGREEIATFCVMFSISLGGATGVLGGATLILIPIGIFLSQAVGFDRTLGLFMIFFRQFAGFNVGQVNARVLGVAQPVAEVPLFSDLSTRVISHIANFTLSYAFAIFYLHRIREDPFRDPNCEQSLKVNDIVGYQNGELSDFPVTKIRVLSMLYMATGLAAVVVGALKFR